MRKGIRIGLVACGVVLVAVLFECFRVFYGGNDFHGAAERVFTVSRGESFPAIADSLFAQGLVDSKTEFTFVGRVLGGAAHIKIGRYLFANGISSAELFLSLRSGRGNSLIPVTVPEGLRARAQAHLLARTIGIDSARFVALVDDADFARTLGVDAPSLEGYLFPETYHCYWQQDEKDVIRMMVEQLQRFFNDSLQARARSFGWDERQALTFASIIEGEALIPEDRAMISGVYHNRLRRDMPLEADPTIQYILEDGPRRVLYTDLQIDDPYNTYRYKGLPPGPVNNPGKASIMASLYPVEHHYLYFVANGEGGHWFSSTLEEHVHYVRMYRRLRAKNHMMSPIRSGDGKSDHGD